MRDPLDGPQSSHRGNWYDAQALDLGGCCSRHSGALVPSRRAAAVGGVASGPITALNRFRELALTIEGFPLSGRLTRACSWRRFISKERRSVCERSRRS